MSTEHKVFTLRLKNSNYINYTYIILDVNTGYAALIDPSWQLDIIRKTICELNANLKAVFLTHSHFDHTNLVQSIIDSYNPLVYISRTESEFYKFYYPNFQMVDDGDVIKLGNTKISCIETPGHTAGSMCFLLSDSIFTGDTVFIEGCGICSGDGACPSMMFNSINRIKREISNNVRVYPGHSYGSKPGLKMEDVHKINIYFQINKRDIFIDFRMRNGQKKLFDFK